MKRIIALACLIAASLALSGCDTIGAAVMQATGNALLQIL